MNRYIQYLVLGGLIFGFIVLCFKKSKSDTEKKMLPVTAVGVAMLAMSVLLPFFAAGLNLSRVFHIALILFAPCLIYGAQKIHSVSSLVLRHSKLIRFESLPGKRVVVAALLVSYFLFVSGWVWAVTDGQTHVFRFGLAANEEFQ